LALTQSCRPLPDFAELEPLALGAPIARAEYVTAQALGALWRELDTAFPGHRATSHATTEETLKQLNPAWDVVGRAHFNRAENAKDPDAPFAFLATYVHQLSNHGKVQRIPLNDALREYAGSKKRQRLLFTLRKVDATDLISNAGDSAAMAQRGPGKEPVLADANLSELIALEMAAERDSAAGATVADRKPSARGVTPSKKSTKEKLDRKTTSARQKAVRSTRTSTERQAAVMGLGPRSPSGR